MKKTLFFALLVSCLSFAQSQILTVSYNDEAVNNGDTLTVKATSDDLIFRPVLYNNEPLNIVAQIAGEKLNNTTTEITSICAEVCRAGYLSSPFIINGNSSYEQSYIDFSVPEDAADGLFKISIYDTADRSTEAYFYLIVKNKNSVNIATTQNTIALNAYPNPAKDKTVVEYSMDENSGTLVLYNMSGKGIKEVSVSGNSGRIALSISDLPSGIYMYGIHNSQGLTNVKKLVIR